MVKEVIIPQFPIWMVVIYKKKWDLENELFRPGVNLGLQGLGLDKRSINLGSKLDILSPAQLVPLISLPQSLFWGSSPYVGYWIENNRESTNALAPNRECICSWTSPHHPWPRDMVLAGLVHGCILRL